MTNEQKPEQPEERRQVWRARCSACDFISEGTESLVRHDGQKHRQDTGHCVSVCFDLIGLGMAWL